MTNTIQPAYIYQLNHKAGLSLCGFSEEQEPQWLGSDKEFKSSKELFIQYYS